MSGPLGAAFGGMIDRIVDFTPHESIRAVKCLSYRESYLRDHFPGFPLMPGALQLEATLQAAQWLLRASHEFPACDFFPSVVKNTRYSRFVVPGDRLEVQASVVKADGDRTVFKGEATVEGERSLVTRFELVRYEATWTRTATDPESTALMVGRLKSSFQRLRGETLPHFEGVSA